MIEYTRRFDRLNVQSMADLELARDELQQALDGLPSEQREALEVAARRVRSYHERQILHSWQYEEEDADGEADGKARGTLLGQKVTPLDLSLIHI